MEPIILEDGKWMVRVEQKEIEPEDRVKVMLYSQNKNSLMGKLGLWNKGHLKDLDRYYGCNVCPLNGINSSINGDIFHLGVVYMKDEGHGRDFIIKKYDLRTCKEIK